MPAVAKIRSPVGVLAVEAGENGLRAIRFASGERSRPALDGRTAEALERAVAALRDYFKGGRPRLPELDLAGSPFQLCVWNALLEIPYGEVVSYGELAARIGRPGAARAVGGANHENPVPILVPCHRVVASGGRLGGYAGGTKVKEWLLAHEAAHAPALRPPGKR